MFTRRLFSQLIETAVCSLKNDCMSLCFFEVPEKHWTCVSLRVSGFTMHLMRNYPTIRCSRRRAVILSSATLVLQLCGMKTFQELLLKKHMYFSRWNWEEWAVFVLKGATNGHWKKVQHNKSLPAEKNHVLLSCYRALHWNQLVLKKRR